jgi:hypothetical protein
LSFLLVNLHPFVPSRKKWAPRAHFSYLGKCPDQDSTGPPAPAGFVTVASSPPNLEERLALAIPPL